MAGCTLALTACVSTATSPDTKSPSPMTATPGTSTASPTLGSATASPSPQPPTISALPTMTFVDELHGWFAFGDAVLATQDGGYNWAHQSTLPGVVARLSFTSIDAGWAVARDELFTTGDAGKTWHQVLVDTPDPVIWVQFIDSAHGWVFTQSIKFDESHGYPQTLFSTANAGKTWRRMGNPCPAPPIQLNVFSFVTQQIGFVLCIGQPAAGMAQKQLFKTAHGGQTWVLIETANMPGYGTPSAPNGLSAGGYATDLNFLDDRHGWISETRGPALVMTTDGGVTWSGTGEEDQWLVGVSYVTPKHGWVLAHLSFDGTNYKEVPTLFGTDDGGRTWTQLCTGDFTSCR